ncbi:MAG: prepilin peptidase [Gemmatimonadota bacterium]|jgi:prepilin peptidase CpaA
MSAHSLADVGPLTVLLAVVLVLAVWFDVGQKRIPNWLTVGGMVGALVLRGVMGAGAFGTGLLGGLLGLSLGLLLFTIGAMGAGDGKLLATVGACLGLGAFVQALPLIGLGGGLLALVVAARARLLIPTLLRFRDLLFHIVSFGRIGERRTLAMPGAVTVPYGLAVAAGVLWAWMASGISP